VDPEAVTNDNTGLITGIIIAGVLLLLVFIVVIVIIARKRLDLLGGSVLLTFTIYY
jgi:uncharacterized integral membrane protein